MPSSDDPASQSSQIASKKSILSLFGWGKPAAEDVDADPLSLAKDVAADLINHAREFQTLRVADVMTPRADIVAADVSCTLADVVKICIESEHSRLPIFRETLDDPIGVLHIKDLLKVLSPETVDGSGPNWAEPILHRLRRDVLYVPVSMKAHELLLRMQTERTHMAMVIDEFGGTDGLVTMEDLIEAVVGDIDDEYDDDAALDIIEHGAGVIEADGRVELKTLEERLNLTLYPEDTEEEVDTLGGLVAVLAGRVPRRGEVVRHKSAGFDIEVMDADTRRIKRLRLHPLTEAQMSEDTDKDE
ncbi:hemolysin family protein [Asticcacaulis machinosus]|uniref:Hemolysin family protein n=1 Tax=Asticcacaulis machinosus TaxID=2984211 RepID=A0ABT5HKJ4_9CAUL|nr:hemolysin family protein [Asticcacaulis machinosus]MDC7676762.1 hemolysin family protein [Asticcacaulis machinosus]